MKKIFTMTVLLPALVFFYTGCDAATDDPDFFDFTEPRIVSIAPSDNQTGVNPFEKIVVEFSEPVQQETAERAFSLQSPGNVEGFFSWQDDQHLVFSPTKGWTAGEKYTISIRNTLEDLNRNKLKEKKTSYFYAGLDFTHPEIDSATDNPYVQTNDLLVTLVFTKPMDRASLQQAVRISPAFEYRMDLSDDRVLSIYTRDKLPGCSEYTLTVKRGALCTSKLPLLRDYEYHFAMYSDLEKPALTALQAGLIDPVNPNFAAFPVLTDNSADPAAVNLIEKKASLIFCFSEPMERSTVESSLSIYPPFSFTSFWYRDNSADCLVITPAEPGYEQGKEYTVQIKENAFDLAGNRMDKESSYYVIQADITAPIIEQVIFNENLAQEKKVPDLPDAVQLAEYNDIVTGLSMKNKNTGQTLYHGHIPITLCFAPGAPLSDINLNTLYSNIRVRYLLGSISTEPLINSFEVDTVTNKVTLVVTAFLRSDIPGLTHNTYQLEVVGGPGGIKDIHDNYMEESFTINFQITGTYP